MKRTDLNQANFMATQSEITQRVQAQMNDIASFISTGARLQIDESLIEMMPLRLIWAFASKDQDLEVSDDIAEVHMYGIGETVMQIRRVLNQAVYADHLRLSELYQDSMIEFACNVAISRSLFLQGLPLFPKHLVFLSDQTIETIELACASAEIACEEENGTWIIGNDEARSYLKSIGY